MDHQGEGAVPDNNPAAEEERDAAAETEMETEEMRRKVEALEEEETEMETEEMRRKVEALEEENAALVRENEDLRAEIEEADAAEEHFEDQRRELEAVAKRNVEIECEMDRLQADLVNAIHAGEDAAEDAALARRMLGASEVKLEEVRKEKAEVERKVRDLERQVGILEVRETEEKSKRVRLEEEAKERAAEKERVILELEAKVAAAEKEIAVMKEGGRVLNGIEIRGKDVGINASRVNWGLLAGSVGAVSVVAAAGIVIACRSRKV